MLLKGFFLEKDESIVPSFSADKGRTGILIAIDTTLEQAAQEDMPAIVIKMRQCMKMIQNSVAIIQ